MAYLSPPAVAYQPPLIGDCPVATAVEKMAAAGIEARGAVFTRPEVVEFILDLVGYTADQPLHRQRLLEPSFGGGDFLLPVIERLLNAYQASGGTDPRRDLADAITAVELHRDTHAATRTRVIAALRGHGLSTADSASLAEAWLVQDDFLLREIDDTFHYVVGNPPYVRQELIPNALIEEYRRRYATIYDRADIYIPFIERSLTLLRPKGVLGFICADRWTKNRYGGPLRRLVAENYHLRAFVDMVDTPAFLSDVIAYPGIFIIANERGTVTTLAHRPQVDSTFLKALGEAMRSAAPAPDISRSRVAARGPDPWIMHGSSALDLVRRLEAVFPTLEYAGCKVGIGVATGADKAFIGPFDALDVEDDRKLPLVMTRDILNGTVEWRGLGVVNPFADEGGLVRLDRYPRLKRYLEARRPEIASRHVAQKAPANWYRTIDRIYPELVRRPKLLIPDIKGEAHIVYDEGCLYPHHNLYFVTSESWDMRALQAVLRSGIARLFVATYSTKMRGGYLRFQAQYLRRIRVPAWSSVPSDLQQALVAAGATGSHEVRDRLVQRLYGLTDDELAQLAPAGEIAA